MNKTKLYFFLNFFFGLVWIINGIYCKILNFEPRHQQIVGEILGSKNASVFTLLIGVLEVLMAIWIFLKIYLKLNAIIQIVVVATMNILEFFLVPELLLWGKWNLIFAIFFIVLIYYKEFILKKQINHVPLS